MYLKDLSLEIPAIKQKQSTMIANHPRILLTGATGYIGGTVLTHLLNSQSRTLRDATITCLVRGEARAVTLSTAYGKRVRPVVYQDLDDLETTSAIAAEHDLVINTTLGFHLASAQALLRGLAQRQIATGRNVYMIHTSGVSNLGDMPISGTLVEDREFDDGRDDIYTYEKEREIKLSYPQRSTEISVVDAGITLGVQTLVIMSPTIYGVGTGLFNTTSVQIPTYIRSALDHGCAVMVGDGQGVWDHVHVEDLAELYGVVAREMLEKEGRNLPKGKNAIIFSGNGRHSWADIAQGVANALYEAGKLPDRQVESIGLTEATNILSSYLEQVDEATVEVGLASNSRTVSTVARGLGWKPSRGKDAWQNGYHEDVAAILAKRTT